MWLCSFVKQRSNLPLLKDIGGKAPLPLFCWELQYLVKDDMKTSSTFLPSAASLCIVSPWTFICSLVVSSPIFAYNFHIVSLFFVQAIAATISADSFMVLPIAYANRSTDQLFCFFKSVLLLIYLLYFVMTCKDTFDGSSLVSLIASRSEHMFLLMLSHNITSCECMIKLTLFLLCSSYLHACMFILN